MYKPVRFGRAHTLVFCCLLGLTGCQALSGMARYPEHEATPETAAGNAPSRSETAAAPTAKTPAPAPQAEPPHNSLADARTALIGTGVKPVDSGGLAYYMDVQEAKLRQRLGRSGIEVRREDDKLRLILPVAEVFEPHSTQVAPHFYERLNTVALVLKEYGRTVVRVDGYTDSSGGAELNRRLSRQRAQGIADYLVRQGINRQRLVVRGLGEASPVADNRTAAGRARNRRVELILIPLVAG